MQVSISLHKLQLLKHVLVLHDLQGIKHIASLIQRSNASILEEVVQACLRSRVVVAIRGSEGIVLAIPDDRRLNMEEGDEVGDLMAVRVLHDIAAQHVLAGSQEVADFFLSENGMNSKSNE